MVRPTILMAAAFCLTTASSTGGQGQPASTRVVHLVAERFVFTPSEITVEQGTVIELRITSEDTDHGFRVIGLGNIDVEIPKRNRGEARVTLVADEPGDYAFECSRVCGAGHGFMRGRIRVQPKAAGEGRSR